MFISSDKRTWKYDSLFHFREITALKKRGKLMHDETNIYVKREADPSVGCLSPANGGASVQEVSHPGPRYSRVVLSRPNHQN